jgi:hypothetical protein
MSLRFFTYKCAYGNPLGNKIFEDILFSQKNIFKVFYGVLLLASTK